MSEGAPADQDTVAQLRPDPIEEAERRAFGDDIRRMMDALAANSVIVIEDVAYAAWKRHSVVAP